MPCSGSEAVNATKVCAGLRVTHPRLSGFKGPEMAGGSERKQARPEVTQQRGALPTMGAAAPGIQGGKKSGEPLGVVGWQELWEEGEHSRSKNYRQHLESAYYVPGMG